jgi:alpha-tubulin suppressor-like RCC1 family protein
MKARTAFAGRSAVAILAAGLSLLAPLARAEAVPETIGGQPVVEIAVGANHSGARVQNGRVWCWGFNVFGQLGDGTNVRRLTPVRVAN